jgi:hypothetical protein
MRASAAICGALGAGLGVLLAVSCFVGGYELVGTAGAGGGSPDGGPGGTAGCRHATWPTPPETTDPGADLDLVFAMRKVDFGQDSLQNGPALGYDLDTRCTCQGEGPSCLEPAWAYADHCDGPEGRDNASSQLFHQIETFTNTLSSDVNSQLAESGNWTLLARLRQYNGQANDQQVVVSLYPSPGRDNDACFGAAYAPAWDGSDEWPISADSLEGAGGASPDAGTGEGGCRPDAGADLDIDAPLYTDPVGYVHDWVLVANLPQVGMILSAGDHSPVIRITAGFLTARLDNVQTPGRWLLRDGLLGGRWKLTEFLAMLGSFTSSGDPVCTDTVVYAMVKPEVCSYADLASTLGGPTTPCDAISFGMGFEGENAKIGHILFGAGTGSLCPPATDPAYDNCG